MVYFYQHLGSGHYKRWWKSAFFACLQNLSNIELTKTAFKIVEYLYQWCTGNGTAYILFRYQRTTDGDVTECEWLKQKSARALQRRLAYVWLDQTKWPHNNSFLVLFGTKQSTSSRLATRTKSNVQTWQFTCFEDFILTLRC